MTTRYIAAVELDHRGLAPEAADALLDVLASHHPALSVSGTGRTVVTLDVPADDVGQAAVTAVSVAAVAGRRVGPGVVPVAVDVVREQDRDAREGWAAGPPDLLSVVEVAAALGVTRQAVQQMTASGRLPHVRVGRAVAVPRAAVEAFRAAHETAKAPRTS